MSISIQAQNYVPLSIDSLYSWSWLVDMHSDTIIDESWTGYTYDLNDSLIQLRNPLSRVNYSYGIDTTFLLAETLDTTNNWYISVVSPLIRQC